MNQIILASHGGLAEGARDTLSMVLGDVSNVHVVTLARDDKEPISKEVERLVASFDANDAVYVCTDMLGSSVNNSVVELMNNGAKITVISGMNMPLMLSLAIAQGPLSAAELRVIVRRPGELRRARGARRRSRQEARGRRQGWQGQHRPGSTRLPPPAWPGRVLVGEQRCGPAHHRRR